MYRVGAVIILPSRESPDSCDGMYRDCAAALLLFVGVVMRESGGEPDFLHSYH